MSSERANALAPYVGKEVVFGVRPEHLNDKALTSGTAANVVRAQVEVIEQMGATSNLYISLGGHALVSVVDASTNAKENAPLDIVIDADHCHVFDKDTEQAIF
jgi:multiple sugar transport system ATP-binding protein